MKQITAKVPQLSISWISKLSEANEESSVLDFPLFPLRMKQAGIWITYCKNLHLLGPKRIKVGENQTQAKGTKK